MSASITNQLIASARKLRDGVDQLEFSPPVSHVYNPLAYAWKPHELYLRRFGNSLKRVVFIGMNPGPFGMTQTGIPFGEVAAARDWLGITAPVGKPRIEHRRRPVLGFDCPRSEISGKRLWGLFAARFGSPEKFFAGHLVVNYCPLVFLEESGRNRTPDKLPPPESGPLIQLCNIHLRRVIQTLQPEWIIGVGAFAAERARDAMAGGPVKIGRILHPSPASPLANRDWAGTATRQLEELGVWEH
jgi:single-strand selective monofunctional uracil DNA glycosylase